MTLGTMRRIWGVELSTDYTRLDEADCGMRSQNVNGTTLALADVQALFAERMQAPWGLNRRITWALSSLISLRFTTQVLLNQLCWQIFRVVHIISGLSLFSKVY